MLSVKILNPLLQKLTDLENIFFVQTYIIKLISFKILNIIEVIQFTTFKLELLKLYCPLTIQIMCSHVVSHRI